MLLVGLIVTAGGGGSAWQSRAATTTAWQRANILLAGIPQSRSTLGDREAPVTLQFFGDLECPEARRFAIGALPFIVRRWVRDGQLQIKYRATRTDTPQPLVFEEQQVAALAAGMQGRMWNFALLFYREQGPEFSGYVTEAFLNRLAVQAGLNLDRWHEARGYGWTSQLESDAKAAKTRAIVNTPAFLIGRTGRPARRLWHFSLINPQAFDEAIEGLLRA